MGLSSSNNNNGDDRRKGIQYAPLLGAPRDGAQRLSAAAAADESAEKIEDSSSTAASFEGSGIGRRTYTFSLRTLVFWFVAQFLLIVALVVVVALSVRTLYEEKSDGTGLKKGEYAPLESSLETQQLRFAATTFFNKSDTPHQTFLTDVPIYVGSPNAGIDKAWSDLIDNQYFYISDEEARRAWGEGYEQYYSEEGKGYRAGLDVFHTLHCLNLLRRELYWEHYRGRPLEGFNAELQSYHIDHCIDVIRQSLQCSSDVTPIPVRWYESETGHSAIDSERVHTCRNNAKIREWTTEQVAKTEDMNLTK